MKAGYTKVKDNNGKAGNVHSTFSMCIYCKMLPLLSLYFSGTGRMYFKHYELMDMYFRDSDSAAANVEAMELELVNITSQMRQSNINTIILI
mgnify:CR=1 FL=1